jgi:hypothetical protein
MLVAQIVITDTTTRAQAYARVTAIVGGIALIWLLVFAWLATQGSLASAQYLLLAYPAEYASLSGGTMTTNILAGLEWRQLVPHFFRVEASLILLCLIVLLLAFRSGQRAFAAAMLFWMCGIFIAVAVPGHFYPHYYQLWLPWLALTLAFTLDILLDSHALARRPLRFALAGMIFVSLLLRLWPQYALDANEWSNRKYGSQFVQAQIVGRQLGKRLAPDQRLFVFGVFPGLYEAAGREPPSNALNVWFALPQYGLKMSATLNQRLLGNLQQVPPDLIVLDAETWALAGPGEPIREWIAARYRVDSSPSGFAIAVPVKHEDSE